MKEDSIKKFLQALSINLDSINVARGYCNASCPLAFYTHGGGEDEHPSFGILINDSGKSIYYCFGCSPDPQPLIRLLHNMWLMMDNYPYEAAKIYAREEIQSSDDQKGAITDIWEGEIKEKCQPLPIEVVKRYPLLQYSDDEIAERCKEYLRDRGITETVFNLCQVRYSPDDMALVFPLTDVEGNIYVIRMRSVLKEKQIWTLTPKKAGFSNMLFPKIKDAGCLFGMKTIDFTKPVMIVEGEIDQMRLMSLGYFNVVASATSSITKSQVDSILSDVIILGFDSDEAGKKANRRVARFISPIVSLLRADWMEAEKKGGKKCKDAGDLPNRKELLRVLGSLKIVVNDETGIFDL